jgi:hypothetical protein
MSSVEVAPQKPPAYGKWRSQVLGETINNLNQLKRWTVNDINEKMKLWQEENLPIPKFETFAIKLMQQHKEVMDRQAVQVLESIDEEKRIESEHPADPTDEEVERLSEKVQALEIDVADVTVPKVKGNVGKCLKAAAACHMPKFNEDEVITIGGYVVAFFAGFTAAFVLKWVAKLV